MIIISTTINIRKLRQQILNRPIVSKKSLVNVDLNLEALTNVIRCTAMDMRRFKKAVSRGSSVAIQFLKESRLLEPIGLKVSRVIIIIIVIIIISINNTYTNTNNNNNKSNTTTTTNNNNNNNNNNNDNNNNNNNNNIIIIIIVIIIIIIFVVIL